MKLQEAQKRVSAVERCKGDNEVAHQFEDRMLKEFVKAVRDGKYRTRKEIIEVAKELSKVYDIRYARWYA